MPFHGNRQCSSVGGPPGESTAKRGFHRRKPTEGPIAPRKSLAVGTGGLWFENFMGDAAHYDITGPETTTVAVPPKQGETSGCAFVQLKAGTYHIQGKTDWGGQVDFDIEVEAGMISQIPILVEGT